MSVPGTAFTGCGSKGAYLRPDVLGQSFYQPEVHMGVVNGLQVVVHGLGLGQGGHRLLHQGCGDLFGKAEPGAAAPQDLTLGGRVQPDTAAGLAREGQVGGGGEEGQPQLGDEQMGQPIGGHRVGTGHYIVAVGGGAGQQVDEQLMGQPAVVGQDICPAALGQGSAVEAHRALVSDCAQKTLLYLAGLPGLLPGDLPVQNAASTFGQLLGQRVGEQGGALVLHNLRRRPQTAVGPLVAALVPGHAVHNLLPQRPQGLLVIALPHVDIPLHCPGIFGLHHMGRCDLRTLDKLFECGVTAQF